MNDQGLSKFLEALPEQFPFFDLGEVKLGGDAGSGIPEQDATGVAFTFRGDLNGLLILFFEKGLDDSLYMEVGNILASKTVSRLYEESDLYMIISPPRLMSEQFIRMISTQEVSARRKYIHHDGKRSITLQTFVVPIPLEGVGYA